MKKYILAAGLLSCVPSANWLIGNVGTVCIPGGPCLIPVAPGLMAPSGVLMIGLALVLRDQLHEVAGRWWVLAVLLTGSVLSLAISPPALAYASAAAFLLAELLDFAVYDRLRARGRALAVAASGAAGAVLDSLLFSWLAFGDVKWAWGLVLAKFYASAAFAIWLYARKSRS
jgi:uncharacterized PurR-regulated membrane protein YhhQ (DUF165 family)